MIDEAQQHGPVLCSWFSMGQDGSADFRSVSLQQVLWLPRVSTTENRQ